jgi:hypothetical protein
MVIRCTFGIRYVREAASMLFRDISMNGRKSGGVSRKRERCFLEEQVLTQKSKKKKQNEMKKKQMQRK